MISILFRLPFAILCVPLALGTTEYCDSSDADVSCAPDSPASASSLLVQRQMLGHDKSHVRDAKQQVQPAIEELDEEDLTDDGPADDDVPVDTGKKHRRRGKFNVRRAYPSLLCTKSELWRYPNNSAAKIAFVEMCEELYHRTPGLCEEMKEELFNNWKKFRNDPDVFDPGNQFCTELSSMLQLDAEDNHNEEVEAAKGTPVPTTAPTPIPQGAATCMCVQKTCTPTKGTKAGQTTTYPADGSLESHGHHWCFVETTCGTSMQGNGHSCNGAKFAYTDGYIPPWSNDVQQFFAIPQGTTGTALNQVKADAPNPKHDDARKAAMGASFTQSLDTSMLVK